MRRFLFLFSCAGLLLCGEELPAVHSVYLLPMSRSLDQYLANLLTSEHVFHVVTDPKMADAIFTDRIGEAFEGKLMNILSASEPVEKESDDEKAGTAASAPANKLSDPMSSSSFGRTRGMVFLVDPKSHRVLWSAYQPPKNTSAPQLERSASDIVSRLKRDLKKQQQ